jgi:isoquinoline 1-oxidoreductase subunit alpha
MQLNINGQERTLKADPATPLLWVLRDEFNLTGTKFGCGVAACGACTIHIDGQPVRSCLTPASVAAGKKVRTVEDLSAQGLSALQQAWVKHQVPQCGYCQSGMLMAASALLEKTPNPSDADIDAAMTNICRCGTYGRIRAAIKDAAQTVAGGAK